ncbi:hypothetical protein KKC94_03120 [Patescibacteria group bacterium]|nr:hypothetical protein [Patescibacteria group bacterium]
MKKLLISYISGFIILWPKMAFAHCPLCTVGAGSAALLATWLGINTLSIGLFIGAFAMAMALWVEKISRKFYTGKANIAFLIVAAVFLTTILPLLPMMPGETHFSIFLTGNYGSILNRTYLINLFLIGSLIGGLIMYLSPFFSKQLSKIKAKKIPFQGMIISFLTLLIFSVFFEILL